MLILMPVEVFSLFVTGGTILVQKFSLLFRKLNGAVRRVFLSSFNVYFLSFKYTVDNKLMFHFIFF